MVRTILYSTALYDGVLIKAEEANRGEAYSCPVCQGEMVLKQGTKKRPHFAHKALTENCTPESALHYSFKRLLAEALKAHIIAQRPLQIAWSCYWCLEEHVGNLIKRAQRVEVEYRLGPYQPDIALLDTNDRVIAVIEVVVTHPPEERVLEYYRQKSIGVVIFRLESEDDLNRIGALMRPDEVDSCLNPRCKRCDSRTNRKDLAIIESTCGRCRRPMLVVGILSKGALCGEFYPSDLELAKSKGVRIGYWQSNRSQWQYPTSACPNCQGVIGLPWLWDKHVNPQLGVAARKQQDSCSQTEPFSAQIK